MKVVYVKFSNKDSYYTDKEYVYLCDDDTITKGDHVVVDTPINGFKVVRVTRIGLDDTKATKCVVCKVDTSRYEAIQAKAERRKELLAALDRKQKEATELAKYAILEKDAEAQQWLEELKSL